MAVLGIVCPECGCPAETLGPGDAAETDPVRVPGYEILGTLGRGGMGVVYKALQVDLNRMVALKMILAAGHAGAEVLARFRTEAEAVARLRHPHIVQALHLGSHLGMPFLVLEYVDGPSLDRVITGTPWPPERAARLTETLARATHHAHRQRVLHRDLKPANILMAEDGQPRITDFGLARWLDEGPGQTLPGVVMGTPNYMAPEQAQGQARLMGPATDVYALGAILYELLTGRPPFRGETALETLDRVRHHPPVPPRRINPKVPAGLEAICLKCLAKRPGQRPADAEKLADDLRRFLDNRPLSRRRFSLLLTGGVLTVGALAAAGVGWVAFRQPEVSVAAPPDRLEGHYAGVWCVTFSPDGHALLSADAGIYLQKPDEIQGRPVDDGVIRFWDARTGREWRRFGEAQHQVFSLAFVPGAGQAVSGGWDGTVRLWDVKEGRELQRWPGHPGGVTSVAVSPDGRFVASGCWGKEVRVWDLTSGQSPRVLGRHDDAVRCVAFSPDGRRVVSGGVDKMLRAWSLEGTGGWSQLAHDDGHPRAIDGVAYSPDGDLIASVGLDAKVRVWDAVTGQLVTTLLGHTDRIWSVAFTPDGRRIVTSSNDRTVRLWGLDAERELACFHGHKGGVVSVAVSADGLRAASAGLDRVVRLWDLPAP